MEDWKGNENLFSPSEWNTLSERVMKGKTLTFKEHLDKTLIHPILEDCRQVLVNGIIAGGWVMVGMQMIG